MAEACASAWAAREIKVRSEDGRVRARALESRKQQSAQTEGPEVTAAQVAEDRGFEPRKAVKPNRISSAAP
jgi:hypothetical protein